MGSSDAVAALAGLDCSGDCAFAGIPESAQKNIATGQMHISESARRVQKIRAKIDLARLTWTDSLFRFQKASQCGAMLPLTQIHVGHCALQLCEAVDWDSRLTPL